VFAFFGIHTTLWFARTVRAKEEHEAPRKDVAVGAGQAGEPEGEGEEEQPRDE
jgi:hypothetical protein